MNVGFSVAVSWSIRAVMIDKKNIETYFTPLGSDEVAVSFWDKFPFELMHHKVLTTAWNINVVLEGFLLCGLINS